MDKPKITARKALILVVVTVATSIALYASMSLSDRQIGFAFIIYSLVVCGALFGILVGISKIIWYHFVWMLPFEIIVVDFAGAIIENSHIRDVEQAMNSWAQSTVPIFLPSALIAFVIVRGAKWLYFKNKSRITVV